MNFSDGICKHLPRTSWSVEIMRLLFRCVLSYSIVGKIDTCIVYKLPNTV